MKWFLLVLVIVVLLSGSILLFFYAGLDNRQTELLNPHISPTVSGGVAGDVTEPARLESEIPVDCVLSFGTYSVTQSQCDELTITDTTPDPSAEMISCILPGGTFSLTSHECEILKTSTGSRDVMKTLD